jgi:hypothetical protein
VEEVSMKSLDSKTWGNVAVSAAALSAICGSFVPFGYPWPSVALGVLACGIGVWLGMTSILPSPPLSDLINDIEAESPGPPTRTTDIVSGSAIS